MALGKSTPRYLVTAASGGALVYLINVNPSWQALPLLTPDTAQVLGLLNAFVAAVVAVNLVFVFYDSPWFKALCWYMAASVGLAALVRTWMVFPFHFDRSGQTPAILVRLLLVAAMGGAVAALSTNLGRVRRTLDI